MKRYIAYDARDTLSLFSVWGHSSEYVRNVLPWSEPEAFISLYENEPADICRNPTVIEYVRYIKARQRLVRSKTYLYNPTDASVYLKSDGAPSVLTAGALFDGKDVYDNTASYENGAANVSAAVDLRTVTQSDLYTFSAAFDENGRLVGVSQNEASGGTASFYRYIPSGKYSRRFCASPT